MANKQETMTIFLKFQVVIMKDMHNLNAKNIVTRNNLTEMVAQLRDYGINFRILKHFKTNFYEKALLLYKMKFKKI